MKVHIEVEASDVSLARDSVSACAGWSQACPMVGHVARMNHGSRGRTGAAAIDRASCRPVPFFREPIRDSENLNRVNATLTGNALHLHHRLAISLSDNRRLPSRGAHQPDPALHAAAKRLACRTCLGVVENLSSFLPFPCYI